MPIIKSDPTTNSNYYHAYYADNGFKGHIILNPRDAMVFAHIDALPNDTEAAVAAVKEYIGIVDQQYGAKASLQIPPELLEKLPTDTIVSGNGVGRYMDKNAITQAINKIRLKPGVGEQLKKFDLDEYQFLTTAELRQHIEQSARQLAEFKIKYSSFASQEKISNGQYSWIAEMDKLANPFSEHYVITHDHQIIGCEMEMIDHDKAYDADYVIHPNYRNAKLAQAMVVKIFDHTIDKHPELTGAWFIAGGYGGKDVGAHLYDNVFPSRVIQQDVQLQRSIGLFFRFGPPGPAFLNAANRDLNTKLVKSDENDAVKEALGHLSQSKEENLAASQPQAKPSSLIANSTFKDPNQKNELQTSTTPQYRQ